MKKQNIAAGIIVSILALGGAFYGGMQYGTKKAAATVQAGQGGRNGGNFGGGAAGGQRGAGQGGQGGGMRGGAANGGAGDFASGQITAKDDTSVTVKMRDGSSKIVFFSASTGVDKSVSGSGSDLNVGQQVTVNGKSSPDGTLTAQNIQIRPAQPTEPAK